MSCFSIRPPKTFFQESNLDRWTNEKTFNSDFKKIICLYMIIDTGKKRYLRSAIL